MLALYRITRVDKLGRDLAGDGDHAGRHPSWPLVREYSLKRCRIWRSPIDYVLNERDITAIYSL